MSPVFEVALEWVPGEEEASGDVSWGADLGTVVHLLLFGNEDLELLKPCLEGLVSSIRGGVVGPAVRFGVPGCGSAFWA
ncbi:MAG: hypothetical protein ACK5MT_05895 [Actinomycetales bacterium]